MQKFVEYQVILAPQNGEWEPIGDERTLDNNVLIFLLNMLKEDAPGDPTSALYRRVEPYGFIEGAILIIDPRGAAIGLQVHNQRFRLVRYQENGPAVSNLHQVKLGQPMPEGLTWKNKGQVPFEVGMTWLKPYGISMRSQLKVGEIRLVSKDGNSFMSLWYTDSCFWFVTLD